MFPIGAVERDTGIARDTLRIWERRYGFPVPERNTKGERVYTEKQVRILQHIKRLLDQGMRPGKVVGLQESELDSISDTLATQVTQSKIQPVNQSRLDALIHCVASHDSMRFSELLEQTLIQQGLETFIIETVVPLIQTVGHQWAKGELRIFEEHFITRQLTLFLDSIISKIPLAANASNVILATLPGEPHSLGLLMLESLLRNRGVMVVNLGTEVPMDQLTLASEQYQPDAVLLSFSGAYNSNGLRAELLDLAQRLPDDIPIYVGGGGVKRMRKLPEQIIIKNQLEDIFQLDFTQT